MRRRASAASTAAANHSQLSPSLPALDAVSARRCTGEVALFSRYHLPSPVFGELLDGVRRGVSVHRGHERRPSSEGNRQENSSQGFEVWKKVGDGWGPPGCTRVLATQASEPAEKEASL